MNFALRRHATQLGVAAALLAATVIPMLQGWWDSALPAAIGSAMAALLVFAVLVNAPLQAIAYVALYTERQVPPAPRGFGDPLDTKAPPVWHEPRDALPVVEQLLPEADVELRPHLEYLRSALATSGRFYFLVQTWAGGTNARVEALRHGDMSVIARQ